MSVDCHQAGGVPHGCTSGEHLGRLRDYGDLLYTLSAHRISVRYKQTSLGFAWAVLQPLLMMVIFTAVFSVLAKMPSDGVPYALFAYTALLPWTFFNTAVPTGPTRWSRTRS